VLALVTNREDLTADWLVIELARRGIPYVRVNSEDFPEHTVLRWENSTAQLHLATEKVDAAEIDAVWWRRSIAPQLEVADRTPGELTWAFGEALVAWDGFWQTIDAHWVNHPTANAHADRKPLQLRAARRLGMSIPDTLITNAPDIAQSFVTAHPAVICKPLHSGRVRTAAEEHDRLLYTQTLAEEAIERLDEIGPEPYLFQRQVPKASDVRVTVIGDAVFACRITPKDAAAAGIDWRATELHDLDHRAVALPTDLEDACRKLTRTFGLRFSAIDLAVTTGDEYVFFEINPNGQWAWIEQITGQPLRAALADELVRGSR